MVPRSERSLPTSAAASRPAHSHPRAYSKCRPPPNNQRPSNPKLLVSPKVPRRAELVVGLARASCGGRRRSCAGATAPTGARSRLRTSSAATRATILGRTSGGAAARSVLRKSRLSAGRRDGNRDHVARTSDDDVVGRPLLDLDDLAAQLDPRERHDLLERDAGARPGLDAERNLGARRLGDFDDLLGRRRRSMPEPNAQDRRTSQRTRPGMRRGLRATFHRLAGIARRAKVGAPFS